MAPVLILYSRISANPRRTSLDQLVLTNVVWVFCVDEQALLWKLADSSEALMHDK